MNKYELEIQTYDGDYKVTTIEGGTIFEALDGYLGERSESEWIKSGRHNRVNDEVIWIEGDCGDYEFECFKMEGLSECETTIVSIIDSLQDWESTDRLFLIEDLLNTMTLSQLNRIKHKHKL